MAQHKKDYPEDFQQRTTIKAMHPRLTIIFEIILAATISILASVIFFHERLLYAIGDQLIVRDMLIHADLIHIIAGEDYRTEYAIKLYKSGYGDRLFFTGGWCSIHQDYHGQRGKRFALAEGIPQAAIAIDDTMIMSTYDEVLRLKEYLSENKFFPRTIIVVSDPYHMKRARWTYRKIFGPGVEIIMAPVPFELTPYQRQWWRDEKSIRMVRDEYIKMLFYYARHQYATGKLQDLLAHFDRN